MTDLTSYTNDELLDLLEPLVKKMNRLAEIYETDGFGTKTLSEVDAEVQSLYREMKPLLNEIARRFPGDEEIQQLHRLFKLEGSRLRAETR